MIELVTIGTHLYHYYANMLEIIRDFMNKDWNFFLKHTLCEGNACVYIIAKMRVSCLNSLIMVNESSPILTSVLLADTQGLCYYDWVFVFDLVLFFLFLFSCNKKNCYNIGQGVRVRAEETRHDIMTNMSNLFSSRTKNYHSILKKNYYSKFTLPFSK